MSDFKPSSEPTRISSPWEWHIAETYKGLITISVEVAKMLAVVNGGAAVAVLAYLGNIRSTHAALMTPALRDFCLGLLGIVLALIFAYLTQLRLYNEERARHNGQPFRTWHPFLLGVAIVLTFASAIFFFVGCMVAASVLGKIQ